MRKLVLLVAVLCPLALRATTFGPEIAASRPAFSSAFGSQQASGVACDGDSCVALWLDPRSAREGLYSAVIDADGSVHPASSNLLRSGMQGAASIAWTGDHYLALWGDGDHDAVVAAPLARDGRISGEVHTVLAGGLTTRENALAWNGRRAFGAFRDLGGIWAAILDANGAVVRTFVVHAGAMTTYAVAASGSTFAVAWEETRFAAATVKTSVYVQRYDESGHPIDVEPVVLASDLPISFTRLGIAGSGSQFGVAFTAADDGSIGRVRVDASTGAIDHLPASPFVQQIDGVYWNGDDFIAYGSDLNVLVTSPFSADAQRSIRVSPANFVFAGSHVAALDGGAVAIWNDSRFGNATQHVFGALLDREVSTIVKGDLAVSLSAVPQTRPALAASPHGALLVWNQQRDEYSAETVALRVDPLGNPIDATPVSIATDTPNPAITVAWLGDVYLVVWSQFIPSHYAVLGKRVSATGEVLDADPIVFAQAFNGVVATNGSTSFLVLSSDKSTSLLRLNAAGGVIDSQPLVLTTQSGDALAATSGGDEFVIVWTQGVNGGPFSPPSRDVYAIRLDATGQPIDSTPIAIANSSRDELAPAVASDGRDFLVAYNDAGTLEVKRLLAEGSLADTTSQEEGLSLGPVVNTASTAWIGGRYVLAWCSGDALGFTAVSSTFDATGAQLDDVREIGRSGIQFDIQTALVSFGERGIVAYSRGNPADVGIPRVFTRQVVNTPSRMRAVRH